MNMINIIGAGRLGKTIGHLISSHKLASIQGICNQSLDSAHDAIHFIGQGTAYETIGDLPSADITLITTTDETIENCALQLSQSTRLKKDSVIIHCSGIVPASILRPLEEQGCYIGSIHPLRSFANPAASIAAYPDTYCAADGDPKALAIAVPLFEKIGSVVFTIDSDKKALYHTGAIMAANYLVALFHGAQQCFEKAGIEKEHCTPLITSLMTTVTDNLSHSNSAEKSLTGPIKRGDSETIQKHLDTLAESIPELVNVYKPLGQLTLELTSHKEEQLSRLRNLFS